MRWHISTPRLHTLRCLHLEPINVVISHEPSNTLSDILVSNPGVGFVLRCFQRLSIPNIATRHLYLVVKPVHQRFVHSGPLVLGTTLLRYQTPATDRDQPVSRRFEPSSRALLIGEQTNAWELLHPRARASRHRIHVNSNYLEVRTISSSRLHFYKWRELAC